MNYRNVLLLLITFIFAATTMLSAKQVSYEEMEQYAKQKYPELFLPKDEFETTDEYNQRLRRQLEVISDKGKELLSELKAKRAETERLEKEVVSEKERQKQIKITESLQKIS